MKKNLISSENLEVEERIDSHKQQDPPADCFVKDICQEYAKLAERLQSFQPKRRRIRYLAVPKYTTPKFRPTCPSNSSRKTQIIRDPPCMTRTEQLAYPSVRKLLPIRRDFGKILGSQRLCVLNRTIRKSVLSLYSRLANVQAPREKEFVSGWTKKDWAIHRRYLSKLSQPKKTFKPPKGIHMWKDIKLMKRYKKLCKPKKRIELEMSKWELSSGLKNYKPTERILLLSKPKERDEDTHFRPLPIKVTQEAMKYKPSERIKQLATPPEVRLGESDLKENPFGISPNALKAKPSDRITELSQPKDYQEGHVRQNPFMISPAALKAKASSRIIELAKPKGST